MTTSLFWTTFAMFLKDWGTALTQALYCWNTLQTTTVFAPPHWTATLLLSASAELWLTGAQVLLFGVPWALLSHIYCQRGSSPPAQQLPQLTACCCCTPFQRVREQSLLTPRPSGMHCWHFFQPGLFFLCSLLPPLSSVLLVCLTACSQCTRLAALKQRTAASFSYLKANLKLHFLFMCNGPFLMHMEFIQ